MLAGVRSDPPVEGIAVGSSHHLEQGRTCASRRARPPLSPRKLVTVSRILPSNVGGARILSNTVAAAPLWKAVVR